MKKSKTKILRKKIEEGKLGGGAARNATQHKKKESLLPGKESVC